MDIVSLLIYIAIGLSTGILSGLFGVGGGFILVPLLVASGVSIHMAIGTSLGYIFLTSMYGSVKHFSHGYVYLGKTTGVVILSSIVMVGFGARLNGSLDESQLAQIFAILLLLTATYFAMKKNWQKKLDAAGKEKKKPRIEDRHWISSAAVGATVGTLSGLFGVGGGFLLVPAFVLVIHMPIKKAVGTSLFIIIFSSVVGATFHAFKGNIDYWIVPQLVIGGVVGVRFGANLAHSIKDELLEWLFIGVLASAAIFMAIR